MCGQIKARLKGCEGNAIFGEDFCGNPRKADGQNAIIFCNVDSKSVKKSIVVKDRDSEDLTHSTRQRANPQGRLVSSDRCFALVLLLPLRWQGGLASM